MASYTNIIGCNLLFFDIVMIPNAIHFLWFNVRYLPQIIKNMKNIHYHISHKKIYIGINSKTATNHNIILWIHRGKLNYSLNTLKQFLVLENKYL